MDLVTSSAPADAIAPHDLTELLAKCDQSVLMLVIQTDAFARTAWRCGRRCALALERKVLRALCELRDAMFAPADVVVHAPRSECFAIAFIEGTRNGINLSRLAAIEAAISEKLVIDCVFGWVWIDREDPVGERLAAVGEAARMRRQRREFAALLHDIATPLSSIHSSLNATIDGILEPSTEQRFLRAARDEAARAVRLIRNFLTAESSQAQTSDLGVALQQAAAMIEPLARERDVTVAVGLSSRPALASIGFDQAVTAVATLLDNAVKHGRAHGSVRAELYANDRTCQVIIDDDGPGVPADERERVFDFGVRRPGSNGSGIGLTGVRTIVERCRGWVSVADSELGGARFTLGLPSVPADGETSVASGVAPGNLR